MVIKKKDMIISIYFFLLLIGLIRISYFSNTVYRAYSFVILGILFLMSCRNLERIKNNVSIILLGTAIALSVLLYSKGVTGGLLAITYFLQFVTPYFLCFYISKKYGFDKVIMGALAASFFVTLLMDVSVLMGVDADLTHYQNLHSYLFGNKFNVAYLHMQTLGLIAEFILLKKRKISFTDKLWITFYGIFGIFMCHRVDCSTGIMGNGIIILLLIIPFPKIIYEILLKPTFIFVLLAVANISFVGTQFLIKLPIVRFIIEKVLHRDLSLTGRLAIYAMLPDLFKKRLLLGYGYNSDIFAGLIGYGNAQNGILQYMIDCGLIGTALFLNNWRSSIRGIKRQGRYVWPLICAMYGFMICGLVEVCFKLSFILILALISSACFMGSFKEDNKSIC